jgi:transposase
MSTKFKSTDRNQQYMFPPTIDDWLPENHLARFVVDIVGQLDIKALTESYRGSGSKAYHPEILLSLLFYGYATGVYSSRKIEQATYDSVAFRFISANTHPDHDTIATFRKRFLKELKPLFIQILLLSHEMGFLKLGKLSLDGTKIKANASKHHALSWEYACKLEKQLQSEVDELMRLAEHADSAEVPEGMNIPDELSRRTKRLAAIADAKEKIEKRAEERFEREQKEYKEKQKQREEKQQKTGKKPRGRGPNPPQSGPRKKDQINLTDEESRIMPSSGKGFEQSYNAQASVDVDTMLIVGSHVSQSSNDKKEIKAALSIIKDLPDELGKVTSLLADAGYFSADNVSACENQTIEPYISPGRNKHSEPLYERFASPEELSENADTVALMKYKLKTPEGRKLYAKRKCTVEPVFGIIKHVMGFRQFLLRGIDSVSGEWDLVSIAWNIKRMFVLSDA